ncbi:MAG: efflux RND transporter periplasmic adaptor subunit [Planctomycetaceae bacterium]
MAPPSTSATPPIKTRLWRGVWMLGGLAGIVVLVGSLVRPARLAPAAPRAAPESRDVPASVQVEKSGLISIAADSPLNKHLSVQRLESQFVQFPAMTVSGSILARIRAGDEPIEDRWQFSNAGLATSYADWLRTKGELEFARSQLIKTRELASAQIDYLQANLRRLEPLWKSGNVPEKDYKAAQADLLKAQLQGEKDIFAAESTLRTSQKNLKALERDLSQDGIEPVVFGRAVEHMVLVSANVPETKISQVHEGQGCLARFYAFPERKFDAHVEMLSALLTQERRTLPVLFEISDSDGVLRPGMFAEVGLGTDEREAILLPGDALLHINMNDYVLVSAGAGLWKPTQVRVGEQFAGSFEVLEGLQPGQTVISRGAILLKPSIETILREQSMRK